MRKKTNNILGLLVCGTLITGLAACSSSPSPWSQGDDSPWKDKRTAEDESAPSDEFVDAAPMEDAVEEPAVSEAWPYTAPSESEPANNQEWVLGLPAQEYAVQLFAGRVMANVSRYQETHGLLNETKSVKTERAGGDIIYVLVHSESDLSSAKQYAASTEEKTGSTPWIRTVGGLQKITAR